MYFPEVVYWCQYNWLSASLIKFLLESKFAARNAKASSSSQGPRHGNITKLRFNSNLTANEGAPFVCHHCRLETRTFCFSDAEESWYRLSRLWLSVFKRHFILNWVENFKIQVVLNGFFQIQAQACRETQNVPILFWNDCCQKLFGSSCCQIHPKTLRDEWGWIHAAG